VKGIVKPIIFCCATLLSCLVGEAIAVPTVEVTAAPTAVVTITEPATATATAIVTATPVSVEGDILVETPERSAFEVVDTPAYAEQGVVVVSPGANLLPAPKIEVATPGLVTVSMPEVTVQLSNEQIERAARVLRRRFGLSHEKGRELLYNPENFRVLYSVKVERVRVRGRFEVLNFAEISASRRDSKVRQIRSRLRTVTLRKLKVGVRYRISYSVEIILNSPRLVIGRTGSSASVTLLY
jgi:hypothetical protein